MSERSREVDTDAHAAAATAFARRVTDRYPALEELILFGSTARGDATGTGSDVDFLAVVADDAGRELEDELRDVAYDTMLEFGPVVEVHVLSNSRFERYRDADHPFVRSVLREGRSYV
jgi:predicted nucleotidyltransferase